MERQARISKDVQATLGLYFMYCRLYQRQPSTLEFVEWWTERIVETFRDEIDARMQAHVDMLDPDKFKDKVVGREVTLSINKDNN